MPTYPLGSWERKIDSKNRIQLPRAFTEYEEIIAFTYIQEIGFTHEELYQEILEADHMHKLAKLRIDDSHRINLSRIISEMNIKKDVTIISLGRFFRIEDTLEISKINIDTLDAKEAKRLDL
jgi:DNA-binding transcriptional regulator/RsmH inhibitor MraZ